MSRRMIDPQVVIKSQVRDDKFEVYLNEILEKYGITTSGGNKTITLQIYNKKACDEPQNYLYDDSGYIGNVFVNGSITITKDSDNYVYIQGMLVDSSGGYISLLEIQSGSYENGIKLDSVYTFDLYVIRV